MFLYGGCFIRNHATVFMAYKVSLWKKKTFLFLLISSLAFFFTWWKCISGLTLVFKWCSPVEDLQNITYTLFLKRLSVDYPEKLLKLADGNKISIWAVFWCSHNQLCGQEPIDLPELPTPELIKLLPLHSSMGLHYAHHIVNAPMDRLHVRTKARGTSVTT